VYYFEKEGGLGRPRKNGANISRSLRVDPKSHHIRWGPDD
jgi:hypothetical protein